MKTTINAEVINVLKSVSNKELKAVDRIVGRAIRHGVSINKALEYEQFSEGDKVKFKGARGDTRYGIVKKVNQVRVRVLDKTDNKDIFLMPKDLEAYTGKFTPGRKPRNPSAAN